ncbi:MAG: peptidylprolyl isomerase [Planctomycetota bacterium]|jgi:parvulin-like peptidyl-prolyl isomerase
MMCGITWSVPVVLACMLGCTAPRRADSHSNATPEGERATARNGVRLASQVYDQPGDGAVSALTVNGETVEAIDLCRERWGNLKRWAKDLSRPEYRAVVERESVQWITDKITEMLMYERASLLYSPEIQANIDKYVDGEIRKIVTANHAGIQRRYEKHLATQGLDIEDARAKLRREIIIASYLESEIKPKIGEPTRADLLAAFEASRDSYRKPSRRKMSLIDVRVIDRLDEGINNPSPQQLQAARENARSIIETARAELAGGKEFADVARRYSDGLHKTEGGAWGWLGKESVRERFEPAVDALFQLEAGKVSEVVTVDHGFFVVRCDEIDPGVEPSFQDVQPALRASFSRASYNRLIAEFVTELRRNAHVEPANLERFHAAVVEAALDREFTETQ